MTEAQHILRRLYSRGLSIEEIASRIGAKPYALRIIHQGRYDGEAALLRLRGLLDATAPPTPIPGPAAGHTPDTAVVDELRALLASLPPYRVRDALGVSYNQAKKLCGGRSLPRDQMEALLKLTRAAGEWARAGGTPSGQVEGEES
jgi:transcriptional regulator with XRE-family HTH domain